MRRLAGVLVAGCMIGTGCAGGTNDSDAARQVSAAARFATVRDSSPFRFVPPGARVEDEGMTTTCVDPDFDRREPKLTRVVRSSEPAEVVERAIVEEFRRDGWTVDPEVHAVTVGGIAPQTVGGATKQFPGWTASLALWSIADTPEVVSVSVQDVTTKYCDSQ